MSDDTGSDLFGPLERSGAARGWALVVLAVVVGALLMPSATRTSASATGTAVAAGTPSGGAGATTSTTAAPGTTTTTAHRATTTTTFAPTVSPSSIKVLVANGTNTNGAAASVSAFLSGKGFVTGKPANALTTVSATQVYAVNGAVADAQEVAQALGLGSSSVEPTSMPAPVSSTGGANVVVIVGPDVLSRSSTSTSA